MLLDRRHHKTNHVNQKRSRGKINAGTGVKKLFAKQYFRVLCSEVLRCMLCSIGRLAKISQVWFINLQVSAGQAVKAVSVSSKNQKTLLDIRRLFPFTGCVGRLRIRTRWQNLNEMDTNVEFWSSSIVFTGDEQTKQWCGNEAYISSLQWIPWILESRSPPSLWNDQLPTFKWWSNCQNKMVWSW